MKKNKESEDLQAIELSQEFAKEVKHNHVISGKECEVMATKFLYSMMTFNMIYERHYKEENGRDSDYASTKIERLINDVFSDKNNIDLFLASFKSFNRCENLISIMENIASDDNIDKENYYDFERPKRTYKDAFKSSFNNMISKHLFKNDILLIVLYINQIRNNVFHGSKNIEHAMTEYQSDRLKVYSDIILSVNEAYINYKKNSSKN